MNSRCQNDVYLKTTYLMWVLVNDNIFQTDIVSYLMTVCLHSSSGESNGFTGVSVDGKTTPLPEIKIIPSSSKNQNDHVKIDLSEVRLESE